MHTCSAFDSRLRKVETGNVPGQQLSARLGPISLRAAPIANAQVVPAYLMHEPLRQRFDRDARKKAALFTAAVQFPIRFATVVPILIAIYAVSVVHGDTRSVDCLAFKVCSTSAMKVPYGYCSTSDVK